MADHIHITRTTKRCAIAVSIALVAGLGAWINWLRSDASATPPPPAPAEAPTPAVATSPVPAAQNGTSEPTTTQITFVTSPSVTATVTWGATRLGRIRPGAPLVVERPRDSGPLDVIVRAPGFLPVHTRAHTFADSKLLVKLTRPEDKATLIGYRAPIDAGVPLDPDGGVPPAISGMPPSLADPAFSPIVTPNVTPMTPATPPATPTVPPAIAR